MDGTLTLKDRNLGLNLSLGVISLHSTYLQLKVFLIKCSIIFSLVLVFKFETNKFFMLFSFAAALGLIEVAALGDPWDQFLSLLLFLFLFWGALEVVAVTISSISHCIDGFFLPLLFGLVDPGFLEEFEDEVSGVFGLPSPLFSLFFSFL